MNKKRFSKNPVFVIFIFLISLTLANCGGGGEGGTQTTTNGTTQNQDGSVEQDSDGIKTVTLSPENGSVTIGANSDSKINKAKVTFPAGSFTKTTEVTLQEGVRISGTNILTLFGIGQIAKSRARAVMVTSSDNVETKESFTVLIPLPVAAGEFLDNLIIVYLNVQNGERFRYFYTIDNLGDSAVSDNMVKFKTRNFGIYQAVVFEENIFDIGGNIKISDISTTSHLLSKADAPSSEAVIWVKPTADFDPINRTLTMSSTIGGSASVSECMLGLSKSPDPDLAQFVLTGSSLTHTFEIDGKDSGLFSWIFSCTDSNGRGTAKTGLFNVEEAEGLTVLNKCEKKYASSGYEGDCVDGVIQGFGKINISDGVYVGDFTNGKKSGLGAFVYNDGYLYEGEFEDNKPKGYGVVTFISGTTEAGFYEEKIGVNRVYQFSEITFTNGNVYTGKTPATLLDTPLLGIGTLTQENGITIHGGFNESFASKGKGVIVYNGGDRFEGDLESANLNPTVTPDPEARGIETTAKVNAVIAQDNAKKAYGKQSLIQQKTKNSGFTLGKYNPAVVLNPTEPPKPVNADCNTVSAITNATDNIQVYSQCQAACFFENRGDRNKFDASCKTFDGWKAYSSIPIWCNVCYDYDFKTPEPIDPGKELNPEIQGDWIWLGVVNYKSNNGKTVDCQQAIEADFSGTGGEWDQFGSTGKGCLPEFKGEITIFDLTDQTISLYVVTNSGTGSNLTLKWELENETLVGSNVSKNNRYTYEFIRLEK